MIDTYGRRSARQAHNVTMPASGLQGGFQVCLGSVPSVNQGRAIFQAAFFF